MRRHLLTLFVALASVFSAHAQSFEWGTASWNVEDGKVFTDIDDFNAAGLTLSYTNPANYTLTFFKQ